MRHLSPRALVARVGRRGGCLIFFGLLDVLIGQALISPPLLQRFDPTLVYARSVLPLGVWAGAWLGVGVMCLAGAVVRTDFFAYAAAICLKIGWGLLILAGWAEGKIPLGYMSAGVWLGMAGLVGILSGWPEPVRVRADE